MQQKHVAASVKDMDNRNHESKTCVEVEVVHFHQFLIVMQICGG